MKWCKVAILAILFALLPVNEIDISLLGLWAARPMWVLTAGLWFSFFSLLFHSVVLLVMALLFVAMQAVYYCITVLQDKP